MREHPVLLLKPFYDWLDWMIAEHGVYLYMATVWLSPFLVVWILRGGFWRRAPKPTRPVRRTLPKKPPVLPPTLPKSDPPSHESRSFAE